MLTPGHGHTCPPLPPLDQFPQQGVLERAWSLRLEPLVADAPDARLARVTRGSLATQLAADSVPKSEEGPFFMGSELLPPIRT